MTTRIQPTRFMTDLFNRLIVGNGCINLRPPNNQFNIIPQKPIIKYQPKHPNSPVAFFSGFSIYDTNAEFKEVIDKLKIQINLVRLSDHESPDSLQTLTQEKIVQSTAHTINKTKPKVLVAASAAATSAVTAILEGKAPAPSMLILIDPHITPRKKTIWLAYLFDRFIESIYRPPKTDFSKNSQFNTIPIEALIALNNLTNKCVQTCVANVSYPSGNKLNHVMILCSKNDETSDSCGSSYLAHMLRPISKNLELKVFNSNKHVLTNLNAYPNNEITESDLENSKQMVDLITTLIAHHLKKS